MEETIKTEEVIEAPKIEPTEIVGVPKIVPQAIKGKIGKDGIIRYGHASRQRKDYEMTKKINNGHTYQTSKKRDLLVQNLIQNPEMSIKEASMLAGYSETSPVPYSRDTRDYIEAVIKTKAADINSDWLKDKFQLLSTLAVDDKDFSSAIRCIENLCRMLGSYKDSMIMNQTLTVKNEDKEEAEELISKMYGEVDALAAATKKEAISYDKVEGVDREQEVTVFEGNEDSEEQQDSFGSDERVQEMVS